MNIGRSCFAEWAEQQQSGQRHAKNSAAEYSERKRALQAHAGATSHRRERCMHIMQFRGGRGPKRRAALLRRDARCHTRAINNAGPER
jgi:hypothetical protein